MLPLLCSWRVYSSLPCKPPYLQASTSAFRLDRKRRSVSSARSRNAWMTKHWSVSFYPRRKDCFKNQPVFGYHRIHLFCMVRFRSTQNKRISTVGMNILQWQDYSSAQMWHSSWKGCHMYTYMYMYIHVNVNLHVYVSSCRLAWTRWPASTGWSTAWRRWWSSRTCCRFSLTSRARTSTSSWLS